MQPKLKTQGVFIWKELENPVSTNTTPTPRGAEFSDPFPQVTIREMALVTHSEMQRMGSGQFTDISSATASTCQSVAWRKFPRSATSAFKML